MADSTTMSGFGVESGSDQRLGADASHSAGVCPTCGQSRLAQNHGLEQFLGRLGIREEIVRKLATSIQNADIEEAVRTAREQLAAGSSKATQYAKENPGKVAAGIAALAVGAGLLVSTLNRN